MPRLNAKKCYSTPAKKPLIPADTIDMALFDAISKEISKHITGTYTSKDHLTEQLKIIQSFLKNPEVLGSVREAIHVKLQEGASNCTPGFHDRCNSIVMGLVRPTTLDDFLLQIRRGIVDMAAHQLTDEVHLHNFIFKAANALGFSVGNINLDDVYISDKYLRADQAEILKTAITTRYTPMKIFNELIIALESEFRDYYGYQGMLLESATGYTSDTYAPLFEFLKELFSNQEMDYEEVFVTNGGLIIDLNWTYIQAQLFRTLSVQKYWELTADEREAHFSGKFCK